MKSVLNTSTTGVVETGVVFSWLVAVTLKFDGKISLKCVPLLHNEILVNTDPKSWKDCHKQTFYHNVLPSHFYLSGG